MLWERNSIIAVSPRSQRIPAVVVGNPVDLFLDTAAHFLLSSAPSWCYCSASLSPLKEGRGAWHLFSRSSLHAWFLAVFSDDGLVHIQTQSSCFQIAELCSFAAYIWTQIKAHVPKSSFCFLWLY